MFRELLLREFEPYGSLSPKQLDQLESHYELLRSWNRRMNLTRIVSVEDAVRLHYCESLFLAGALPSGKWNVVDVGSGAGFPGIPLAVARPDCSVTLVESHQRKSVFLKEVARDIENLRIRAVRAEDVSDPFDWMVSRAVSPREVMALNLAARSAVLLGEGDSKGLGPSWEVRRVPWGRARSLAMFHVER